MLSESKTMATLVNFTCKSFIKLTPAPILICVIQTVIWDKAGHLILIYFETEPNDVPRVL